VFDPNIFAVATGLEEHARYGIEFIEAVRWIREHLPATKVSGGVSNLSFSFRGNDAVREAMHTAFLYHAIAAGMSMGIVNAGQLGVYEKLDPELRALVEDVIFDRRPDATERLVECAGQFKAGAKQAAGGEAWRAASVEERLSHALINGIATHIVADTEEARLKYPHPIRVIEGPLMDGMKVVGSHTHISLAALFHAAGVEVNEVPFGAAQVVPSLLGGHVDAVVQLPAALSAPVKQAQVRLIAALIPERDPALPEVPTAREQGVDVSLEAWRGIAVPHGTPRAAIRTLEDAIRRAVESPEFRKGAENLGVRPAFLPAGEFSELIAREDASLSRLMQLIGLKKSP
jgi:hypothetical protein